MNVSPFLRNLAVLAVIAAAIVVFNQETALITIGLVLRVVFFLAIALVAYSLWRDFGRREIATWPTRAIWVFYGGLALLVADIGWWMLSYDISGRNALAFFVVAAVSVYAMVRTWRSQRY